MSRLYLSYIPCINLESEFNRFPPDLSPKDIMLHPLQRHSSGRYDNRCEDCIVGRNNDQCHSRHHVYLNEHRQPSIEGCRYKVHRLINQVKLNGKFLSDTALVRYPMRYAVDCDSPLVQQYPRPPRDKGILV